MNPILKYLKNVFAAKRVLGDDTDLSGLVKADFLLQQLIKEEKAPGIAITVLKEGKTIFQKGYGYADLENKQFVNPIKSIFRIASVSKPIAATALAHMVQEGIIDLDESFYTYLPDYPKKEWDFTIRQLASHTAGIRVYKGKEYGLNKPLSIKEGLDIFNSTYVVRRQTKINRSLTRSLGVDIELNKFVIEETEVIQTPDTDNNEETNIEE